jgi:hypothetical protein
LQFVRKLSGYNKPSKSNEAAFNHAVTEVTAIARNLLVSLETNAEPRIATSRPSAPARRCDSETLEADCQREVARLTEVARPTNSSSQIAYQPKSICQSLHPKRADDGFA